MPIFIKEENQQVANKLVEIPKEMVQKAQIVNNNIGDTYPNDTKRIKRIALSGQEGETYNKKKGEQEVVTDNGKVMMKGSAIKKAYQDLKNKTNPKDKTLVCNGGDEFKNFYKEKYNQLRRAVKEPEIVKQVKDCNKSATKPPSTPTKPIKVGDIEVNVHENKKIYVHEGQLNLFKTIY